MNHDAFLKRLTINADGHVPAVIQDESGRVLTLCYMNRDAIVKTLEERFIYVYRRSLGKQGDILVLQPEGEFFKYLKDSGR